MRKVKYRCKSCGWTKHLPAEWADQKPRFCPTPTCEMSVKKSKGRKSFRTNEDMLEITFHEFKHERKEVTVTSVEYNGPTVAKLPAKEKDKDEDSSGKERRSKTKGTESGAV